MPLTHVFVVNKEYSTKRTKRTSRWLFLDLRHQPWIWKETLSMCLFPRKTVFVGGFFCRPLLWPKTNQAAKKRGIYGQVEEEEKEKRAKCQHRKNRGLSTTRSNVPFQWKYHNLKRNVYYCRIYAIVSCIFLLVFLPFLPSVQFPRNRLWEMEEGEGEKTKGYPALIPSRQDKGEMGFPPLAFPIQSLAVEKRGLSYISESIYFCLQHSKHVCLVCHT